MAVFPPFQAAEHAFASWFDRSAPARIAGAHPGKVVAWGLINTNRRHAQPAFQEL
jgi:hypothetical protein